MIWRRLFFSTIYILVLLFISTSITAANNAENEVDHHPYLEDKECPRKPELIKDRKCLKKCRSDRDCRGRNKKCLCDDVCGKSCVKPSLRCETLKPIFNGQYEITPFNTFGARVRYSCNDGYILNGNPIRVCQGDGYWSGDAPSCETEGSFSIAGKCRDPPVVPHAHNDGAKGIRIFPLGTQLTYSCADGYNIDGFFRAMCVGEGRWVGPRMSCSPRRCPHPGDIPHGRREGNVFIFPNRVTYVCSEGYELVGRPYRVCQASGQWSGTAPMCRPVKCPGLGAPANGHIHGSDFTYGAVVRFSCFRGFQLKGSQARKCQTDGVWSGTSASCAMVDCGVPGPFYNGYLDGQQSTFGAVIIFRCFGRTTFEGESTDTTCQENGEWSHPVPKCWSKCEIPDIKNGTVVSHQNGAYVKHNSQIEVSCNSGHTILSQKEPRCFNGTWSYLPNCNPSSCENQRPPEIRDGMVRYHGVRHGDKAKYRCNTGFKLVGDHYMTCSYGIWIGQKPYCDPVYCPYPGTIPNGQILLVGVIGKYEYRPYVKRIGHNDVIEYQCNKGYKRHGPKGATCIDGRWSPDEKPKCMQGKHPENLYIFRGKRSLPDPEPREMDAGSQAQLTSPLDGEINDDSNIKDIIEEKYTALRKERERYTQNEEQEAAHEKEDETNRRKVNKQTIKTKMKLSE